MTATHSPPEGGVFLALGANLASGIGTPQRTLEEALTRISGADVGVLRVSPWYETRPMHGADQPRYVNGVAELGTHFDPACLLDLLHRIETSLGRERRERWASRTVDLDIVDFRGVVRSGPPPVLPHPGARERLFVLLPLKDVAPDWRHPGSGEPIDDLIKALPRTPDDIERLA